MRNTTLEVVIERTPSVAGRGHLDAFVVRGRHRAGAGQCIHLFRTSEPQGGGGGAREGALPAGSAADRIRPAGPGAAGADARHPLAAVGQDGRVVVRRRRLADAAWEWNARTRLGLHAGDIDDSPQAWAEQRRARRRCAGRRSSATAASCSTPTSTVSRQLTGVRPIQTGHRRDERARPCSRATRTTRISTDC